MRELSPDIEPAREVFLLVGADREDRRVGIFGLKELDTLDAEARDSDMVRLCLRELWDDSGAESGAVEGLRWFGGNERKIGLGGAVVFSDDRR